MHTFLPIKDLDLGCKRFNRRHTSDYLLFTGMTQSNPEATKRYPSPSPSTFYCTTLYPLLLPSFITVLAILLYHSRPRTVKDRKEAILLYAFLEKGHTSTRSSRQNRLTSSPLNTNTYVKRTANRGMRFSLFKFKDML